MKILKVTQHILTKVFKLFIQQVVYKQIIISDQDFNILLEFGGNYLNFALRRALKWSDFFESLLIGKTLHMGREEQIQPIEENCVNKEAHMKTMEISDSQICLTIEFYKFQTVQKNKWKMLR